MRTFNRYLSLQFIRYLFVGSFNTLLSFGVYSAAILVGLRYELASLISIVVGVLVSYFFHGTIVFNEMSKEAFTKYIFAWIILYVINIKTIEFLLDAGLDAIKAGAVASLPMVITAYFIMKHWVFIRVKV